MYQIQNQLDAQVFMHASQVGVFRMRVAMSESLLNELIKMAAMPDRSWDPIKTAAAKVRAVDIVKVAPAVTVEPTPASLAPVVVASEEESEAESKLPALPEGFSYSNNSDKNKRNPRRVVRLRDALSQLHISNSSAFATCLAQKIALLESLPREPQGYVIIAAPEKSAEVTALQAEVLRIARQIARANRAATKAQRAKAAPAPAPEVPITPVPMVTVHHAKPSEPFSKTASSKRGKSRRKKSQLQLLHQHQLQQVRQLPGFLHRLSRNLKWCEFMSRMGFISSWVRVKWRLAVRHHFIKSLIKSMGQFLHRHLYGEALPGILQLMLL